MKVNDFLLAVLAAFLITVVKAEDGHQLWLRKHPVKPVKVNAAKHSAVIDIAIKELQQNWMGKENGQIKLQLVSDKGLKKDGFKINEQGVFASSETGLLYGAFELLRRQQTGMPADLVSNPSYQQRILNHWDNLDGSVERGYAGKSIFWRKDDLNVTANDKKLWQEYARANASIGINGSVLNNVNASPRMLAPESLKRVKAIADVLRPYGIKVYLSVNFSSPARLGGLKTSDPLDAAVVRWWREKAKEIYALIPDFGGFLVKANSEGQPGPQDFGRSHADGANMLADVLKPYHGIVMWRAFVYDSSGKDRARLAYTEFMPLDGKFRDNVIIQVKNGPIDFQPREPFSPLFGALTKTAVMPELQITQEYLGHSYQLVFLSPMWEAFLRSETFQRGKGSTIAKVTDGSMIPHQISAIAGVANTGLDTNWTGHHFAQANWYAFGRLAWNHELASAEIAEEWLKLTFGSPENKSNWNNDFLKPVKQLMLASYEACVNYSMPLGLHHIFAPEDHYGPGPWWAPKNVRKDWTPPYYHQADTNGIGFNRTKSGTDAVSQYHEPLSSQFNNTETCPEVYLLWFHHLPWDFKTKSGRILWDELCYKYDQGIKQVRELQKLWDRVQYDVDAERFTHVQSRLKRQTRDAQVYKDGCLLYFQQFSKRPIPFELERPVYDLNYLKSIKPLEMFK